MREAVAVGGPGGMQEATDENESERWEGVEGMGCGHGGRNERTKAKFKRT